jgi:lipopolysaccharide transport system permease protein
MSTPSTFLEQLNLKRDLWWQFTTRAIEMRHRGSYLGFIWAVLNPLLMAALYVTVFGVIFQRKFGVTPDETAADYAIGVFLGLILFHVVTETISAAPSCIVGQPNLVKKVVFPLAVLPLAQLGSLWFHALISLALFVLASFVLGHGVSLSGIIWLPVILLPHLLLTLGLGWFLASTGVFFRDIAQVMPLFAQVLLYSSAVFFAPLSIPPALWAVLKWNPVLHTIDLSRHVLLWEMPPNLSHLTYTWICGIVMFSGGLLLFRATKRFFPEAI